MTALVDPGVDALVADLRAFRKGGGHPDETRMNNLFDLTEALGEGISGRAFAALERYYHKHGRDPQTDIGAYFYLAGWGVGGHSIDQRRRRYSDAFLCDVSTAWRRSERGITQLSGLIRDHAESSRPWAVVSVFQTGNNFQVFLDFNLGHESWRPPVVLLNGDKVRKLDFHLHLADSSNPNRNDPGTRYVSRIVLPVTRLDLAAEPGDALGRVRVIWNMPVWPVWNTLGWTTSPDMYIQMRTFRQRAIEVSVKTSASFASASTSRTPNSISSSGDQ